MRELEHINITDPLELDEVTYLSRRYNSLKKGLYLIQLKHAIHEEYGKEDTILVLGISGMEGFCAVVDNYPDELLEGAIEEYVRHLIEHAPVRGMFALYLKILRNIVEESVTNGYVIASMVICALLHPVGAVIIAAICIPSLLLLLLVPKQ